MLDKLGKLELEKGIEQDRSSNLQGLLDQKLRSLEKDYLKLSEHEKLVKEALKDQEKRHNSEMENLKNKMIKKT